MSKLVDLGPGEKMFVAALGDNFYPKGVSSEKDVLWNEIFLKNFECKNCKLVK